MTRPVNTRDTAGALLFDMVCTGEGERWSARRLLMPRHGGGPVRLQTGGAMDHDRCA